MKQGEVYFKNIRAGIITEDDRGFTFKYYPDYLTYDEAQPISLTLPLTPLTYRDKVLFPFFDGLIPEGWLLDVASQNWKIDPRDRMSLLLSCCRDCIGAVSVYPLNE